MKAQGLPFNTLVLAVIAIIVVVLLIFIFRGVLDDGNEFFGQQTTCAGQGGTCTLVSDGCDTSEQAFPGLECPVSEGSPEKICCKET